MASATQTPGFGERIGEYFTLRSAAATQAKLGEPARKAIESALALGRQRAEGAEALWSNGHTAEALRLAVESLLDTVKAAPAYGDALGIAAPEPVETKAEAADEPKDEKPTAEKAEPGEDTKDRDAAKDAETSEAKPAEAAATADEKPAAAPDKGAPKAAPVIPDEPWSRALAARGVAPAKVEKAKAAVVAARAATLPLLDADVSPSLAELYEQVLDARHVIDTAFAIVALPARDMGWTRFSRIGTSVLVLALLLGAIVFATHEPAGTFVDASDTWNQAPVFAPEHVIDGDEATYWLLPDGASGWVEARMSPPIHIEHVSVLNTHNPPHDDRATNEYTIEVYSGGEVVEHVDGTMEFSTRPERITHDISANDVERIRFVVRSHHRVGAGLAELSWE